MRKEFAAAGLCAVLAVGCSTFKVPTERFAAADAAIRAADEVGASKTPASAYQIQLAKDEALRARELAAEGENERAHNLLLRAQADAELAQALAREAPLRAQAQEAMNKAKALEASPR